MSSCSFSELFSVEFSNWLSVEVGLMLVNCDFIEKVVMGGLWMVIVVVLMLLIGRLFLKMGSIGCWVMIFIVLVGVLLVVGEMKWLVLVFVMGV